MTLVRLGDRKLQPVDVSKLREVVERDERIRQLEALNAILATEIDKLRPSSELAYTLFFILKDINTDSLTEYEQGFVERMRVVYEAAQEGGDADD